MQGQVHEDVDAVLADELGHLVVGPAQDVAPDVGMVLKAPGEGIGTDHVGVTKDLELTMIVLAEQRQQVEADHVIAEIGRDVADPEAAVGGRLVGVRQDEPGQGRGELRVPAAMLGQDRPGVVVRVVMQAMDKIARSAWCRPA